jgi:pimeloyl-ACP methyl ester carboxylesterase
MFRDVKINPTKVKIALYLASLLQRTPLRFLLLKFGGFSKIDIETEKVFKNKGGALNLAGREGNKRGLKGQFLDLQIMVMHSHESLTGLLGTVKCKSVVWAGAMDCTTPSCMAHSYVEELPNAKLHLVADMGHFLGMKHSTEILKSIYSI